jgi:hypothetical protein
MVQATLFQGCDYLGRVPANVKFEVETVLDDGSYLSWIAPDGKSKKKGCTKIQVRVIEYDTDTGQQTYRLITSLINIALFPALLLAAEYHQRWEIENTIDEIKTLRTYALTETHKRVFSPEALALRSQGQES